MLAQNPDESAIFPSKKCTFWATTFRFHGLHYNMSLFIRWQCVDTFYIPQRPPKEYNCTDVWSFDHILGSWLDQKSFNILSNIFVITANLWNWWVPVGKSFKAGKIYKCLWIWLNLWKVAYSECYLRLIAGSSFSIFPKRIK